jgi:hypothetical protein
LPWSPLLVPLLQLSSLRSPTSAKAAKIATSTIQPLLAKFAS